MASVTPDGKGQWIIRAYLGHARGADGKRRPVQRRRRIEARTKSIALREAQAWEAKLRADGRALSAYQAKDRSVAAAARAWLATIDPATRPKTHAEATRIVDRVILPVLGHVNAGQVSVADVEALWRWMADQGKSPRTVKAAADTLSQVFKVAVRYGWASSNPVRDAWRETYSAPQVTPPSRDDVVAVLRAAPPVDQRLFVVAAGTGMRRGELAGMRLSRLRPGRMVVDAAVSDVVDADGRPIVKDTKTHQVRTVALSPAVEQAVRLQVQHVADRARLHGVELVDDPFLWSLAASCGIPPRPNYLTKQFQRACRDAGVKGTTLHDLRHFFATQSLAEGHAIPTVSGALGHRDSATTLKIYAHADEAAMSALPGWVDEALRLTPELEA